MKLSFESLQEIVENHKKWLAGNGGRRAKFSLHADLREIQLNGVNLREAELVCVNLASASLIKTDLSSAELHNTNFHSANLSCADLSGADLSNASFCYSNSQGIDLSGANLNYADLIGANLKGANLKGANLDDADFTCANLESANLEGVNLSNVNLSGANLINANLEGVKGLGSKEGEQQFAQSLLASLKAGEAFLKMDDWHTCGSAHCIAGHLYPREDDPGPKASRELPTLAKYFFVKDKEAMEAIERVANGQESVFS